MLNKSVALFNEFYGTRATITKPMIGDILITVEGHTRAFKDEESLIHFLMCGTSHRGFIERPSQYYTAFNIAMMALERINSSFIITFNMTEDGRVKLWCRDGFGWNVISTYANIHAMYQHVLSHSGFYELEKAINKRVSLWQRLKAIWGL